jgi:hypothetical protein
MKRKTYTEFVENTQGTEKKKTEGRAEARPYI